MCDAKSFVSFQRFGCNVLCFPSLYFLFHSIRKKVEAFEAKHGRRPRILVCKMGQDGHNQT